ncbi:hypothetical protein [Metabacillus arenae]|uniref:Uncharacterized protein n=1 Tax=Metabacillus arenae TaxID=2771434 RepID=A0A926NCK8_9BACI|nr:hypothetical protein [Metabacillus arenae]MBD1381029.1 hypothetical protein [Metabacillus arenae]
MKGKEKNQSKMNIDHKLEQKKIKNDKKDTILSEKLRYENADEIYE